MIYADQRRSTCEGGGAYMDLLPGMKLTQISFFFLSKCLGLHRLIESSGLLMSTLHLLNLRKMEEVEFIKDRVGVGYK